MTRGKIFCGFTGISLATLGLGLPALAADLPLKAVPFTDLTYPVPLRPINRVLNDETPSPYQLRLQYTGEAWHAEGGRKNGDTYLSNYLASLSINTEKAFGWTGGRFVATAFYGNGESLHNFNGVAQQVSRPIDVYIPSLLRLYQLYYNQVIGNTDFRVGVMDLQTMFGTTKPMDVFLNASTSWTQTLDMSGRRGLNGPSTYPNTSFGARVRHTFNDQWSVQAAVVNGQPDGKPDNTGVPTTNKMFEFSNATGAIGIAEVDYTPIDRTKIMAGYWQYTGLLRTNPPAGVPSEQKRGSSGAYIGGATRLYTVKEARGLDAFVNLGWADSLNISDRSVNAGLVWTGLFDARPRDKLGASVGVAHLNENFRNSLARANLKGPEYETAYELTYRATLADWLTVQPNIQYIVNPAYAPAKAKNAFVFGLHFEMGRLFNL